MSQKRIQTTNNKQTLIKNRELKKKGGREGRGEGSRSGYTTNNLLGLEERVETSAAKVECAVGILILQASGHCYHQLEHSSAAVVMWR